MSIYVIADLHLSFSQDKPMDIFGKNWENHAEKIKQDWLAKVNDDDMVVLPGDFSWAMHLEDTYLDFKYLNELPGKKVLLKGNHDYWWTTVTSMKKFLEEFKSFALRGNVMDMAVGVLIGGAFSGIVTSLTDNFIQPIIKLVMTGKVYTLEEISGYASAFGSSVVNFLIMAFILFCLLKAMNKVMSFGSKPEEPAQPTTKICPFCMSEIDIRATRCPHCTSVQPESEADQK